MIKIVAKKNFTINGNNYIKGDVLTDFNYKQIVKLNEMGFIEPLTYEDLVLLKRELDKENNVKEEL